MITLVVIALSIEIAILWVASELHCIRKNLDDKEK